MRSSDPDDRLCIRMQTIGETGRRGDLDQPGLLEVSLRARAARRRRCRQRWIDALAAHPTLIQRPILTADDGTTVVGRSDEAVRSVLPHEGA